MTPKQLTAFIIGPIATAAVSFITIPIIAWFYSVEDVGRIAMLQITITFSILLFGLGLDQALVREYFGVEDKSALLLNTTLPGLIVIVVVAAFLFVYEAEIISSILFEVDSWFFSVAVFICVLLSFLIRNLSLLLRLNDNGIAFSLSQFLPKVLLLFMIIGVVLYGDNFIFLQLIVFQVLAIAMVALLLLWNTKELWSPITYKMLDVQRTKMMLVYSIPLIFGSVAYWGMTAVDRVFLRSFSTLTELGVYSLAMNFAAAAAIFQSVFGILWSPWIYKQEEIGDLRMETIDRIRRYILFVVVLVFCLVGLFSWVTDWFLPKQYEQVKYYVAACLSLPLLYIYSEVTGVGIGITKRTNYYLLASIIGLIFNLFLNWVLIPIYGAAGAAAATSLSLLMYFFIRTESSAMIWKSMPRIKSYFFISMSVLISVFMALQIVSDMYLTCFWLALLLLVFVFHIKEIEQLKDIVKTKLNRENY